MVKETKDFVSRLFTSTIAWLPIMRNTDKELYCDPFILHKRNIN